jgi:hypothetical protein
MTIIPEPGCQGRAEPGTELTGRGGPDKLGEFVGHSFRDALYEDIAELD